LRLAPLVALGCVGLVLFLPRGASQARTLPASVGHVTARSCASNRSGESGSFFFTAGGSTLLSETSLTVCVSGRLTVTFAGDPAAGCAAHGLCGYSGTESFDPDGVGELNIARFSRHGGRYRTATMVLGGNPGSPLTSAVLRSPPNGARPRAETAIRAQAGSSTCPCAAAG
jgi:hypothetical protein